jgi:putative N6-adenine-specific DNA methylase
VVNSPSAAILRAAQEAISSDKTVLEIFIVCAPGLEEITGRELEQIGIRATATERGGITCRGTLTEVMRANLLLRTASRVTVRAARFHANTFHELERRAKKIPWERFVAPKTRVEFVVTAKKSKLYHSDAVAERLGAALSQNISGISIEKSSAETDDDSDAGNSQKFIVRLDHDECTISADSSGGLLHRRGYRLATAKAPLRETIAAAMILAAGWDKRSTLLDPLCGAGTIPIEAALIARNIAPGLRRTFAFKHWPEFSSEAWSALVAKAETEVVPRTEARIIGSDRDGGAIEAALANAERAGVTGSIDFSIKPMTAAIGSIREKSENGIVITNPPYGKRLGAGADPRDLYASLGSAARTELQGWSVVLLSNERRLIAQLKLPSELLFATSNGGIPVQAILARASK